MRKRAVKIIDDKTERKTGFRPVYILYTPDYNEPGFYRQMVSMDAFFQSMKKRNKTPDGVWYFMDTWRDYERERESDKRCYEKYGIENKHVFYDTVFNSIWEFYLHIGYDYKKQKYINYDYRKKKWKNDNCDYRKKKW